MYYAIWSIDWGWLGVLGDENGLASLVLPKETEKAVYEELQERALNNILVENMPFFDALCRELGCYFNQQLFNFSQFSLRWELVTPYRQKVLSVAREIPYGEVRTYKWLAEKVGNPKGARSVGQALATNPWPILVPCHRVVGSKGNLTGFAGGLEMKQRLIALETNGTLEEQTKL